LPKVNNHPWGENSPNLVTLLINSNLVTTAALLIGNFVDIGRLKYCTDRPTISISKV
jgi:hypothetical protein